jgi:hypothetical protein
MNTYHTRDIILMDKYHIFLNFFQQIQTFVLSQNQNEYSYFSHKINGAAMRYEFRVSTLGGNIVWVCV